MPPTLPPLLPVPLPRRSCRLAAALAFTLAAGGCAGLPGGAGPGPAFDPAQVPRASQRGTNAVRGSAALRSTGGELRTCAGSTVALLPDSEYTRDRMRRLYGSVERGSNDLAPGAVRRIEPADPAFATVVRSTSCDIHGRFAFTAVPDGTWYVTTSVGWRTRGNDPASQAGAALMQRVTLSGGGTVQVRLGTPAAD